MFPDPQGFAGIHTWLDVGCGHGEFLTAIRSLAPHIQLKGTEPNERKREAARLKGLNIDFFDLSAHEETYDVISLMNVYSHLPDPHEFLSMLRKLIRPGGHILIQTGDADAYGNQQITKPWYLPDHLSFANETIIRDLLPKSGFMIERIEKFRWLERTWPTFFTEAAKLLLPNRASRMGVLLKGAPKTDMFIVARRSDEIDLQKA